MEPRPSDYPRNMRIKLEGLIDAALPDCHWKRRFNRFWMDYGLNTAWSRWKAEAPVINESILPLIESTIEELRNWQFR